VGVMMKSDMFLHSQLYVALLWTIWWWPKPLCHLSSWMLYINWSLMSKCLLTYMVWFKPVLMMTCSGTVTL
jgi:hypothetical protein